MSFTLAIVGRPNVGRSTLFNRLVGKRLALVDDQPGVTRDLREGDARLGDLRFIVIDSAGLEMVDTENLRPHYACTLWAWSDALESQLPAAEAVLARALPADRACEVLRAYRLYLSGCALAFQQGWVALHQILLIHPDPTQQDRDLPGTQSGYPFSRDHFYR